MFRLVSHYDDCHCESVTVTVTAQCSRVTRGRARNFFCSINDNGNAPDMGRFQLLNLGVWGYDLWVRVLGSSKLLQ